MINLEHVDLRVTHDTAWTIVTGASGFVGQHLVAHLTENGVPLILVGRESSQLATMFTQCVGLRCATYLFDPSGKMDVDGIIHATGVTGTLKSVIHLAGVAHKKSATVTDFETGIVDLSRSVFEGAAAWATRNKQHVSILNLSSIAARDYTQSKRENLVHYGRAKLAAEAILTSSCGPYLSAMSWRSPAIWAVNAPGAFRLISAFIHRGLPLPFASVKTKRAYINVKNLVQNLYLGLNSLATKPTLRHDVIEVADGLYDLEQICKMLGQSHSKKVRVWPFPNWALRWGLTVVGKHDIVEQIFTPLSVSQDDVYVFLNRSE